MESFVGIEDWVDSEAEEGVVGLSERGEVKLTADVLCYSLGIEGPWYRYHCCRQSVMVFLSLKC